MAFQSIAQLVLHNNFLLGFEYLARQTIASIVHQLASSLIKIIVSQWRHLRLPMVTMKTESENSLQEWLGLQITNQGSGYEWCFARKQSEDVETNPFEATRSIPHISRLLNWCVGGWEKRLSFSRQFVHVNLWKEISAWFHVLLCPLLFRLIHSQIRRKLFELSVLSASARPPFPTISDQKEDLSVHVTLRLTSNAALQ